MSRIHEALKKAEMERAAAQAAASGTTPAHPRPSAEPTAPETVTQASATVDTKFVPSTGQNGHLEFSDLQARRAPHERWHPDPNADVFDQKQSGHGMEQFRTLRSRLYELRGQQPLKTLLVTSSMAGEGKTFVTSNLVRAIVRQPERRVLMIDADLRRPNLHTMFGAPTRPGLSDYLRGSHDETSIIQFGGAGNLCLIPCGTRVNDPAELLSNGRMKTLLERLAPSFDWVVIDSPPWLPVADASVIASWCDGLLLVVRAGYTPSALLTKSRKELKGRNVVGVVLNAVEKDALSYEPYYGGYHQTALEAAK